MAKANPLDGCRAKIDRAWEHFQALQAEIEASNYADAVKIGQQFDPKTNIIKVLVVEAPELPIRWALVAADCLQNFRAALNYLVWELSRLKTPKPNRITEFPFWIEPDEFPDDRIPHLSPAHKAVLKRFQPNTREGLARVLPLIVQTFGWLDDERLVKRWARETPLYALQQLTNRDKHQVLSLLYAGMAGGYHGMASGDAAGTDCKVTGTRGYIPRVLKLGAVWSEHDVIRTGPNPKVNVELQVTSKVGFENGQLIEGLIPELRRIVLDMVRAFERFF